MDRKLDMDKIKSRLRGVISSKEALKDIEPFFDSFSRDELKNILIEAGFDVEDGTGKIIIEEDKN